MRYQDFTDPMVEAADLVTAHQACLDHLRSHGDIEAAKASRLDGWSIGTVVTHVARNADSHVSMLAGGPQYEDGWDGRERLITGNAHLTWDEIVDDFCDAADRVERAYEAQTDWTVDVLMLVGCRPAGYLPLARRRELEVHRVDLGLGYELGDVPGDFVERDLRFLEIWWHSTNPHDDRSLPAAIAEADTLTRWSWLVGRLEVDELAPSGLF